MKQAAVIPGCNAADTVRPTSCCEFCEILEFMDSIFFSMLGLKFSRPRPFKGSFVKYTMAGIPWQDTMPTCLCSSDAFWQLMFTTSST